MSAGNIDTLLDIWAESMEPGEEPPFVSHGDVYDTIDATRHGDAPWKCLAVYYSGEVNDNSPSWQKKEWELYYRDPGVVITHMLDNPDFDGLLDYAAYVGLDKSGKRCWSDFMSGNYAFQRSVRRIASCDKTPLTVCDLCRVISIKPIPARKGRYTAQSSLGATRRPSQWQQGMLNITLYISRLV